MVGEEQEPSVREATLSEVGGQLTSYIDGQLFRSGAICRFYLPCFGERIRYGTGEKVEELRRGRDSKIGSGPSEDKARLRIWDILKNMYECLVIVEITSLPVGKF